MPAPSSVSSRLPFPGSFGAMFSPVVQFYGGVLLTWTQEPEGCKMAKWYFLHPLGNCKITNHYFGGEWVSRIRLVF